MSASQVRTNGQKALSATVAVEHKLTTIGCTIVEVLRDIDTKNARSVLQNLKFEQRSYRFARRSSRPLWAFWERLRASED